MLWRLRLLKLTSAFDFPSWTGPTLVIILAYFAFTLATYRFLGDQLSAYWRALSLFTHIAVAIRLRRSSPCAFLHEQPRQSLDV
jgi:hypothetical protein